MKRALGSLVLAWTVAACTASGGTEVGQHEVAPARAREIAQSMLWNRAPDPSTGEGGFMPALVGRSGTAVPGAVGTHTLVLYDVSGTYGWLGELYGVSAANLASHFGDWTARPAQAYVCGSLSHFDAVVYLGSSFDEPLPDCLLDDVLGAERPVIWAGYNTWQLVDRAGVAAFDARYGFTARFLDPTRFVGVRYKGRTLARYPENPTMLGIRVSDRTRATELATANRDDGSTSPWAVRSGYLTVVAEIPFSFTSEEDRVLAFEDLVFDALAPSTPERHRAMVRIEDVDPTTDPVALHAIADFLSAAGVPFGFGVVARYRDPLGRYTRGNDLGLADRPDLVEALRYMQAHGGTMVMHGFTHQWDGDINPYDQVTGDDTEFLRVLENPDHSFDFAGPLPEDSVEWAAGRIGLAGQAFQTAGLDVPVIWEFPHYSASANSYLAASTTMSLRWERVRYYAGALSFGAADHGRAIGQMFPFVVRDVYGGIVLPENLGNVSLESWYGRPPRLPADIVRAANRQLVVRDNVACFYFHPFVPVENLRATIEGIRALGYEFVSPLAL